MYTIGKNTERKLYEMFGRNKKMADDDLEIIKVWLKTQQHLPEIMDDVLIKNFLNLSKFSLEKTKQRIDMYYTIRSVIPELFEKSNPMLEENQKLKNILLLASLPNLVDEIHRVHYMKPTTPNTLSPLKVVNIWFAMFEVRLHEDFLSDDIVVFDMKNASLHDLTKATPTFMVKFLGIYKKVYALRIHKLLYINCPTYITLLSTLLKAVMPPKIFDRVHFCENHDVLNEVLTKEYIPTDYGGQAPSMQEFNEMVWSKFAEYRERFDLLDRLRVNEDLRPEKLNNDEILGFYGSFKKIDLD